MAAGPHVFGRGRRGLWIAENANLTDKLKHYLPRLRNAIPNLTDLFLPPNIGIGHKDQCRQADFFTHLYVVAHDMTAVQLAEYALKRRRDLGTGAIEFNLEGGALVQDANLKTYASNLVARVRKTNPRLPIRLNYVPFKGQFMPIDLINGDPELYVIAQGYGGNMDQLFAADEVLMDMVNWGVHPAKASVMHAIMCSRGPGPRYLTLPGVRDKGSFYIDDLLLDAGLL